MSGLPVVIQVSGDSIKSFELQFSKKTCIIGDEGEDKEEIKRILLRKIRREELRILPRTRIDVPLTVKDILSLYEKKFGKRNDIILNLLNLDTKAKVNQLSEFEKFKVELAQMAFGQPKLLIVENFLETFEEQLKNNAMKMILKISQLTNAQILFFFSNFEYVNICENTYIIYGGKLLEYSSDSSNFYHPYSQALMKFSLSIGSYNEKVNVPIIGLPSKNGCPYHDYCDFARNNRKLFKICASQFPPKAIIGKNEVYCWLYEAT